jgi:hypothetical protein
MNTQMNQSVFDCSASMIEFKIASQLVPKRKFNNVFIIFLFDSSHDKNI